MKPPDAKGHPRDGFFYPTLTLVIDFYNVPPASLDTSACAFVRDI